MRKKEGETNFYSFKKKVFARKIIVLFSLHFIFTYGFAQEKIISGFVKDSINQPLENATLIASPTKKNFKIKYTTTDVLGFYTLILKDSAYYNVEVSYLGYKEWSQTINTANASKDYNFILKSGDTSLDEIVIDYKYKAIEKKMDTITYNLSAFINGNESKMKDVLNKLPGLQVDGNTIKVKGRSVTKLLVEGKSFFDGSTKLAIENIPADVMEKIEIISDYKESELLRNLADNEELALNVVLKEDKKKFSFGEIQAGLGLNDFYILHPTLFKYSPKSNISFIGDINNFNSSSLTFSDLIRLSGGVGNLLKNNNTSADLFRYSVSGKERFKSKTKFSALNFKHEFNQKMSVEGYGIYSDNDYVNMTNSSREYISDINILETRGELKSTNNKSAVFNLKANYNPNQNEKWAYNINYLNNDNDFQNNTLSNSNAINQFLIIEDGENNRFSHYLEGYKRIGAEHTLGLALNHYIINANTTGNWISDSVFLEDYFPLEEDSQYQISKINSIRSESFNFLLKDYWIMSTDYHLFYSLGRDFKKSNIETNEGQVFSDNSSNQFSENNSNFGNNFSLSLSDFNASIGIKAKFGNAQVILEAKQHYYSFELSQENRNNTNIFIEPKLNIDYAIERDENIEFDYNFSNTYLNDLSYVKNSTITSFNSVLQGNPNLLDEKSHNFSIDYSNYKYVDDFYIDIGLDYSIRNPVKNNEIIQNGITQLNRSIILNTPENNLGLYAEFGRNFNSSSFKFNFSIDWLKSNQLINENLSTINSCDYEFITKWSKKVNKKSHLNLYYKLNRNDVVSDDTSSFVEQTISFDFDSSFIKNTMLKANLSAHFIKNYDNVKNNYIIPNVFFDYKKPNSKFSYGFSMENMLNNGVIITNSFTNNLIVSKKVFTIPRVFLLKLNYKF